MEVSTSDSCSLKVYNFLFWTFNSHLLTKKKEKFYILPVPSRASFFKNESCVEHRLAFLSWEVFWGNFHGFAVRLPPC